jgi:hypothetical protein
VSYDRLLVPQDETANIAIFRMSIRNSKVGPAIDLGHLRWLTSPVDGVILNDTKRVYPYESNTQDPSELDGILKGFRQARPGNTPFESLNIRSCHAKWKRVTPAVAETSVLGRLMLGLVEQDILDPSSTPSGHTSITRQGREDGLEVWHAS